MHRRTFIARSLAAGLSIAGTASVPRRPARAQAAYAVTDLGLPGGYDALDPVGINANGEVVVNARVADRPTVLLYRGGDFLPLGSGEEDRVATALNDVSTASGWATSAGDGTGEGQPRGVLLTEDLTVELVTNGFDSIALGLDNDGKVFGQARVVADAPQRQPVFWMADGMGVLPGLTGEAAGAAYAGNVLGQIAGWTGVDLTSTDGRATLWNGSEPDDLGTLGGEISRALAINDRGIVTGMSTTAPDQIDLDADGVTAFQWVSGVMEPLPALDGQLWSRAGAINSTDAIVGSVRRTGKDGNPENVAVIWTQRGVLPLNDLVSPGSGFFLQDAVDINDLGQILCRATDTAGAVHAVVLTVLGN